MHGNNIVNMQQFRISGSMFLFSCNELGSFGSNIDNSSRSIVTKRLSHMEISTVEEIRLSELKYEYNQDSKGFFLHRMNSESINKVSLVY